MVKGAEAPSSGLGASAPLTFLRPVTVGSERAGTNIRERKTQMKMK